MHRLTVQVKVMSDEDLEEARAKRVVKEAAKEAKGKGKGSHGGQGESRSKRKSIPPFSDATSQVIRFKL